MHYNAKNKRSMKDKVEQLFEDYRLQQKTLTEVKAEILRLFNVVGQSEQLRAFLQEIENDKSYIHNQYFKNKAKTLSERL